MGPALQTQHSNNAHQTQDAHRTQNTHKKFHLPVEPITPVYLQNDNRSGVCCAVNTIQRQGLPAEPEDDVSDIEDVEESESSIQTKLTVGSSDDPAEKQADEIANTVMRMPASQLGKPASQHPYHGGINVNRNAPEKITPMYLQKIPASSLINAMRSNNSNETSDTHSSSNYPVKSVSRFIQSPNQGQPLNEQVQTKVGRVLGADLSDVQVHDDTGANKAAAQLSAKAFTHQNHIYLGAQHSQSDTALMAHEATHVVQQQQHRVTGHNHIQRDEENYSEVQPLNIEIEGPEGEGEESDADLINREEFFEGENRVIARKRQVKAEIRDAEIDYVEAGLYEDLSLDDLYALKLDVIRAKREFYLLEYYHANAVYVFSEEFTADQMIDNASLLSYSEEDTLRELEGPIEGATLPEHLHDILLTDVPELFPETTVNLYKLTEKEFGDKALDYYLDYQTQLQSITGKSPESLIKAFIWILQNEKTLENMAENISYLTMVDNARPILLERRDPNSTSLGINNIKINLNEKRFSWHKALHPDLENNLSFLYPILENFYFYVLYDDLARQMELFRIAAEKTHQRLNQPGAPPDIRTDIQRTYHHQAPQVTRGDMGAGYRYIVRRIEKVMDNWVKQLSWWRRIQEGFGLYDVLAETTQALKALFTWQTILLVGGFIAFLIAIQGVPFANIVVDTILILLGGYEILKFLAIFGLYFDDAADATTFRQLYKAAQGLQGGGEAAAGVLIMLATLAARGALNAYMKYNKARKFKDIDDIANDSVITDAGPSVRSAFKKAQSRSKRFRNWEKQLESGAKKLLENDAKLRKILAEDLALRRLLTFCSSPCLLPKNISAAQATRVGKIVKRLKIKADTQLWHRMREYLYLNRHNFANAIDDLEKAATRGKFKTLVDEAIAGTAEGGIASRGSGGRWQYVRDADGLVVKEYEIARYGFHSGNRGTRNFFQSHHGIQDDWARTRLGAYGYTKGDGIGILLRDRKAGSPHRIVTDLQSARKSGRATRNYAQERQNLLDDMRAAGVPAKRAKSLLDDSDAYFGSLYKQMQQSGNVSKTELRSIFGSWTPG